MEQNKVYFNGRIEFQICSNLVFRSLLFTSQQIKGYRNEGRLLFSVSLRTNHCNGPN